MKKVSNSAIPQRKALAMGKNPGVGKAAVPMKKGGLAKKGNC